MEWMQLLETAKVPPEPNVTMAWDGCQGSELWLRGYPCGLWSLFHVLVASATPAAVGGGSAADESKAQAVLEIIFEYVTTFFGCADCVDHFKAETDNLRPISGRRPGNAAMQLWRLHNKVNRRLANDPDSAATDPTAPKRQFPDSKQCPKCRISRNEWDMQEVLRYILAHYAPPDQDILTIY